MSLGFMSQGGCELNMVMPLCVKGMLLREALLGCCMEFTSGKEGTAGGPGVLRPLEGMVGLLHLAFLFLIPDHQVNSLTCHVLSDSLQIHICYWAGISFHVQSRRYMFAMGQEYLPTFSAEEFLSRMNAELCHVDFRSCGSVKIAS